MFKRGLVKRLVPSRGLFNGFQPSEQKFVYKRKVNSNSELIYDVISNVGKYREFIPYCKESFINKVDANGYPTEAGLRVGFQRYDDKFTCNVICSNLDDTQYSVTAESISHNLFYFLHSKWVIKPIRNNKQSEVELVMRYRFKSAIYHAASSLFAKSATSLVMHAFEKRIYDIKKQNRVHKLD